MLWEKKIAPTTGRSDSTGIWMAEKLSIWAGSVRMPNTTR